LRRLAWAGLACAALIHVGATVLRLEIGLFSVYMMLAALTFFLPEAWLERAARALAWPARSLGAIAGRFDRREAVALAASTGASAWAYAGVALDLPGAPGAAACAACVVLMGAGASLARRDYLPSVRHGFACAAAAVACLVAVSATSVRFDYYRYLGGDLERQDDLSGALSAFEKAERYAPAGKGRRAKIEELRRRLGRGP
jgi:hypothetical protein